MDKHCRDKFVFGLKGEHVRTELLKTLVKSDNLMKTLSDVVVAEARAIESFMQANKKIVDSSKGIKEVHWTNLRHSQMKPKKGARNA